MIYILNKRLSTTCLFCPLLDDYEWVEFNEIIDLHPSQQSTTITLRAIQDIHFEDPEIITITMSAVYENNAILRDPPTATFTIIGDFGAFIYILLSLLL